VKFIPRNDHIVGRMMIKRSDSTIILNDATKVTKYVFVDAVGPGAAEKGIKVGDVVVITKLMSIVQDAGRVYIPFCEEKDVALFATDVDIEKDLLIQVPSGREFVAFDHDQAMQSVGVDPAVREDKAA
jgi:energy-converting hydrogenase Eha subunit G